jgi:membrane-associated phospholipid phosphatase
MRTPQRTGTEAAPALHPVDWVLAAYNVALVPVWLGLVSRSPAAPWLALAHGLAACLPLLLRRSRLPAGVRALVDLTPVLALAFFWAELGALQALRGLPPQDALVRRLDLALFGVHWSEVWSRAMSDAWMSELMHFGYFLYYLVLAVPPIVILLLRGRDAFRSLALAVMVTYLSCFLFYLVFPVYGPRAMAAAGAAQAPSGGFFHGLVEAARESGDSLGTAFPSSHVAGAVTMAWVAWRFLPRAWAALLSIAAALVTLSTVYTENHYAVDALAGFLWVVPLLGWVVPRLESAGRPRKPPVVTGAASSRASSPEVSSTPS